jgi:NAD(P)-dependent dehydrogenase (short-subunit alcohol dehydrogenase family)
MMRFLATWLVRSSAALVTAITIVLALPHRELDWDGTIVPLARKYNSASGDNDNVSGNARAAAAAAAVSDTSPPLDGVVVVVTGATSGIGHSLTLALIRLGATVVALGRSQSKLAQLQKDVDTQLAALFTTTTAFSTKPRLQTFGVDLADLSDVARVGSEIAGSLDRIDILINNAGMHGLDDMFAKNATVGREPPYYDRVFVVNYLSHVLLTKKLWPLLTTSNRRRQAIVAQMTSSFHWVVDGSDLIPTLIMPPTSKAKSATTNNVQSEEAMIMPVAAQPGGSIGFYMYRTQRSYANSKLAQIWHARSLQGKSDSASDSRKTKHGVRVVNICPGWVATNISGPDAVFLLDKIAFSKQCWGIASTLMALFDKADSVCANDKEHQHRDYYTNSKVFAWLSILYPRPTPSWVYRCGLRDLVVSNFLKMALLVQNVAPHAGPAWSSPESYDTTKASALNEWSEQVVDKYM